MPFTRNNVSYELKYSIKRIEMIEAVTHRSVPVMLSGGSPALSEIKAMFAYGLIKEGANAWEPPKKALTIADDILENEPGSYAMMSDLIAEAMARDCAFFFPAN